PELQEEPRMRLLLMTRWPTGYTANRLHQAAAALGHRVLPVDPARLGATLRGPASPLLRGGKPVGSLHGAHLRPGGRAAEHGLFLLKVLECAGVPCLNGSASLGLLRPRALALAHLASLNVPVLRGATLRRVGELEGALALVGGLPAVLHAE